MSGWQTVSVPWTRRQPVNDGKIATAKVRTG